MAITIHTAIASLDESTIYQMLSTNQDLVYALNEDAQTPLHTAAWFGVIGIIDSLLKAGAEVNARDKDGQTPLYIAARQGHVETVKALLEYGADVNLAAGIDLGNDSPLHGAVRAESVEIVKLLLSHGAVRTACDDLGRSPLYLAQQFHPNMVESLSQPVETP